MSNPSLFFSHQKELTVSTLYGSPINKSTLFKTTYLCHYAIGGRPRLDESSSELIAIDTGLEEALSIPGSNRIWILSDSRSAIQRLSNWHKVGDNKGVAILDKLKRISSSREIHVQWVPSHFNIAGNEIADALAKDSATQPTMNSAPLSYSELHSTCINNKQSTVPPAHHWYETKRPGGSLSLQCSRQEQTIVTHFRSGHLRTLTFKDGNKVFRLVLGVLPARHLQHIFLTAWGAQNKIFMKAL
ncbi:RNase H domain-containing protein [Trichonephila clavipes]|nr:RNase H domain-containing protein [Trichonephila clavipes]